MPEDKTCPICGTKFRAMPGHRQYYCSQNCCRKAYDLRHPFRMPKSKREVYYLFAGYTVKYNTPVSDYLDFAKSELTGSDVKYTLAAGNMPPGLRLRCGDKVWEVHGRYHGPQTLRAVTEAK